MMERHVLLLVEDNTDDEKLMLMSLRRSGISNEVVVARDGQEALDKLLGSKAGTGPLAPAVILLDLHLPKIDGLEVLKRIRGDERTRLIPVVVLSSSDEADDCARSYRLGANSYICKPVDFGAFAAAVRELCHYWLLLNRPCP
jgi:CheY-like chemotaxis protein